MAVDRNQLLLDEAFPLTGPASSTSSYLSEKIVPEKYCYSALKDDKKTKLDGLAREILLRAAMEDKIEYLVHAIRNLPAGTAANWTMLLLLQKAGFNPYACIPFAAAAGTVVFVASSTGFSVVKEALRRKNFPEADFSGSSSPQAGGNYVGVVGLNSTFQDLRNDVDEITRLNALAKKGSYPEITKIARKEFAIIFTVFTTFLFLVNLSTDASQAIGKHMNHNREGIELSVSIYLKTIIIPTMASTAYVLTSLAGLPMSLTNFLQIFLALTSFAIANVIHPTSKLGELFLGGLIAAFASALARPAEFLGEKLIGSATGPVSTTAVGAGVGSTIGAACCAIIGEAAEHGVGAAIGAGAGAAGGLVVGGVAGAAMHLMFSNPERRSISKSINASAQLEKIRKY